MTILKIRQGLKKLVNLKKVAKVQQQVENGITMVLNKYWQMSAL